MWVRLETQTFIYEQNLIWFDLIWYDLIWYDLIWYVRFWQLFFNNLGLIVLFRLRGMLIFIMFIMGKTTTGIFGALKGRHHWYLLVEIKLQFYIELAWELSFSCSFYYASQFNKLWDRAKNIPVVLPSSTIRIVLRDSRINISFGITLTQLHINFSRHKNITGLDQLLKL